MATIPITPNIISRQEARISGLKYYFTGNACVNGHVANRLVSSKGCTGCGAAHAAKYRAKNPMAIESYRERGKDKCKKYYKDNKHKWAQSRERNKTKIKDRKKHYYEKQKKRILVRRKEHYLDNRDAIIANVIDWAKRNPDKRRQYEHKRRAQKMNSGGHYTTNDVERILVAQKYKCAICRCSIKEKRHIDHILPLCKSGDNNARNIQLLCPSCNCHKQASDPIDYMQSLGYLI